MSVDEVIEQPERELVRRRVIWLELVALMLVLYLPGFISQYLPRAYYIPDEILVAYRIVATVGRIAIILFIVWIGDGSLRNLGIAKPTNWKLNLVVIGCALVASLALEFIPPMFLSVEVRRAGHMASSPSYSLLTYGIPLTVELISLVFSVAYEEVFSRGYLIGRLREQFGNYWAPILISAILFGAMHLYQGYYGAVVATLLGILFGFVFSVTQRIWPSIVVHYMLDAYLVIRYAYLLAHRP